MKKALTIILLVLIAGSLGTLGFFIYKQSQSTTRTVTNTPVSEESPFPMGSSTNPVTTNYNSGNSSTNYPEANQPLGVPNQPALSQMSLAGITVLSINKNLQTFFTDKETGNIYSLDGQNNPTRLSLVTLPGVEESYLGYRNNSLGIILRQIKGLNIVNEIGQIKLDSSAPTTLNPHLWDISLSSLALSPNSQKISFLTEITDKTILYTTDWSLQKPKKLWSSPLSSWNISWPKDSLIVITSKPSYDYPGVAYFLDAQTGKETKILNNINGLNLSVSPNGDKLIYTKSLLSGFSLYSYDTKVEESRLLDFNTLPDKCVWSDNDTLYCAVPKNIPTGHYPDNWYQGKISFSDNVWKIDLKQKTTTIVSTLKGDYDLYNLVINKQTGWLYALNRGDNKLQAFSLKP